jgi:hypothetical protein
VVSRVAIDCGSATETNFDGSALRVKRSSNFVISPSNANLICADKWPKDIVYFEMCFNAKDKGESKVHKRIARLQVKKRRHRDGKDNDKASDKIILAKREC